MKHLNFSRRFDFYLTIINLIQLEITLGKSKDQPSLIKTVVLDNYQ